jgi:REP element-mobilizing transposase RayT
MVIATHVIFGAYGFWLPNDPRGSWSKFVASWEIFKYGKATTVSTRRSVAHVKHDSDRRITAKSALKYQAVRFNGIQARAIARGFAIAAEESEYVLHACSILPDHVHLVIAWHEKSPREVMGHLKSFATKELVKDGLHPFTNECLLNERLPSPWVRGGWTVYLNTPDDVDRAVRYVRDNPLKEGKRIQHWSFVREYAR